MEKHKNNKIFIYGVIISLVVFILNTAYYMSLTLQEPVFLKHYYELDLYDREKIVIHFIDNSNVKNQLYDIEFPQLPEEFGYILISKFNNKKEGLDYSIKFPHYNYNTIVLEVINANSASKSKVEESVLLDKAIIKYYGGTSQEVDIGKIVINKTFNQDDFTDSIYRKFSNNFKTIILAENDIYIEKIESELEEETRGFMDLHINDVPVDELKFPIRVSKGYEIEFKNTFNNTSNNIQQYNVYNIQTKVHVSTIDGKTSNLFVNLNHNPVNDLSAEKNIINYLKLREVK